MAGYSGYFVYVGGQLLSQTCRTPLLSSEGKTFWETQSVNLDSWTWPWLVLLQREGFPSAWFGISDLSREVTKGSLGYLSSMYFSTSLVLGEVAGPFPQIEN